MVLGAAALAAAGPVDHVRSLVAPSHAEGGGGGSSGVVVAVIFFFEIASVGGTKFEGTCERFLLKESRNVARGGGSLQRREKEILAGGKAGRKEGTLTERKEGTLRGRGDGRI